MSGLRRSSSGPREELVMGGPSHRAGTRGRIQWAAVGSGEGPQFLPTVPLPPLCLISPPASLGAPRNQD